MWKLKVRVLRYLLDKVVKYLCLLVYYGDQYDYIAGYLLSYEQVGHCLAHPLRRLEVNLIEELLAGELDK